jgi:hypothetical protein
MLAGLLRNALEAHTRFIFFRPAAAPQPASRETAPVREAHSKKELGYTENQIKFGQFRLCEC